MIPVSSLTKYRGRFAPTPSGPLHLGSLLTAVASFLQARHAGGAWLLRIDDLDRARCPAGMADRIRRQLEAHALHWDASPRFQSGHVAEYRQALETLRQRALLYPCACTRAALRTASRAGPDGPVYAGTCRERAQPRGALRLRVGGGTVCVDDGWQGRRCRDLASEVGDVAVRRADGLIAYQLACAIDEQAQGITEVVRGVDLLGSTFQQRCIQSALGLAPPGYGHLPVLVDARGRKLSKQNHAAPVEPGEAGPNLYACLALLDQAPPAELRREHPLEIVRWAVAHWDAARVPRAAQIAGGIPYNALQQTSSEMP
jgi:glutamyl-Q tRNA(Asp) synthetase